jgi:hypothetical protein
MTGRRTVTNIVTFITSILAFEEKVNCQGAVEIEVSSNAIDIASAREFNVCTGLLHLAPLPATDLTRYVILSTWAIL